MNLTRRLALVALAFLGACSDGPSHGTVYGDAFLVADVGEEVNLRGLSVHLVAELEDQDSTPRVENLDTILANICVQRDRYIGRARASAEKGGAAAVDSLRVLTLDAYARGWRARSRLLEGVVR
ncbi:MAG: hypothetical protein KY464_00510, partial [Gemmatimonadetes bacterium]|nr:hypothetical protein [Gemmatimonadota bacterium]